MSSNEQMYLGNPLLKKTNTNVEFTTEQIDELQKCADDPVYFCRNYIKIINVDEGLVDFNPFDFQLKLIENFHNNRFNIAKMPRQCGKALALDTKIPTPSGWSTMGDIKVGDIIFGQDGKYTKVIAKSPIHNIDTYEIEFDNGEVIKACGEHKWKVSHSDWYHKEKVLNTNQLIEKLNTLKDATKSSSMYVNISNAIETPKNDNLPIDPYTLGVWLGDGSRDNGVITGLLEDIELISENIPLEVLNKYKVKGNNKLWNYAYKNLRTITHRLGLNIEKTIPEEYLRSSIDQRLNLLRGLMDTDGSVRPNGSCEFYQKEGKLLYQVRELISSLGIKTRIILKTVHGYPGKYGTIVFTTNKYDVFTLPRKLERQRNSLNHPKNIRLYIKDIRQIKAEPMQCLSVDNNDHLFLCGDTFIPTHNSTTVVAYLLHYVIFNSSVNIGILANKAATSKELLGRLQIAYENLPKWMQHGIKSWNKASLELENGSKILAASTSSSAVRGMTFNIIFLDEFAFVPNNIADAFFSSVYPTVTSGKSTKVIIISTPNGMNHFYRMWHDAETHKSNYISTEVKWWEVPGRDEEWKKETIENTSEEQFRIEFECDFLGSIDTLISPNKLKSMVFETPIKKNKGLAVYEDPQEDHNYVIAVDVARGIGKDASAFTVIDVSQFPHKMVARYKDHNVKPMIFPSIIEKVANVYNKAWVLVEINDIGDQVANILFYDLEYENIMMCMERGRAGTQLGSGFSGKKSRLGVRMTTGVKKLGCSNLKTLIESDKVLINDYETIAELTTFIQKNNTFAADDGCNDDLVSCLVIYAWMVAQPYFKELTNNDIRKKLYNERKNEIEQDMAPFGFVVDGMEEDIMVDKKTGDVWLRVDKDSLMMQNETIWNLDEYGDRSYEWEYR